MDIAIGEIAAERIDTQRGAERAAADADVDEVFGSPSAPWWIASTSMPMRSISAIASSTLASSPVPRSVAWSAARPSVGLTTSPPNSRRACQQIHRLGKLFEPGDHRAVEVRLRPVE